VKRNDREFTVLSRNLPEETKKNHENPEDSRSPGRHLNRGLPEYESARTCWPLRSVRNKLNTKKSSKSLTVHLRLHLLAEARHTHTKLVSVKI
jgi:hypothetical protein